MIEITKRAKATRDGYVCETEGPVALVSVPAKGNRTGFVFRIPIADIPSIVDVLGSIYDWDKHLRVEKP